MSRSLAEALISHRPRETAGARSANRFAYQRTWALCHLLQLHEGADDYAVIMEYHEDVLVLDSSSEPMKADFFQIKTASSTWTKNGLLKCPKAPPEKAPKPTKAAKASTPSKPAAPEAAGPKLSILAKLVDNSVRFGDAAGSLTIVSNEKFNLKLARLPLSTERSRTSLDELHEAELADVQAQLTLQLSLTAAPSLKNVFIQTCDMSTGAHQIHGAGALSEFLDRRRPGASYPVQPLYRTLCDELERRATYEWQASSMSDLCEHKGITRSQLEGHLTAVEDPFDSRRELDAAIATLSREGMPFRQTLGLQRAWQQYALACMDEADTNVQKFRAEVRLQVPPSLAAEGWTTLLDLLAQTQSAFVSRFGNPPPPYDYTFLQGAILYELSYFQFKRQLQAPTSQPPKEAS